MQVVKIVEKLIKQNITIGSVESFTGGLFAARLVDVPGVSKIFKGAIVAYQNEVKAKLVGVNASDLEKYGAVSSIVAQQMARNGKAKLNVDFCFAFTGNADTNNGIVEGGNVYIALAYGDDEILEHIHIKGDRTQVRNDAVTHAFTILERVLENYN